MKNLIIELAAAAAQAALLASALLVPSARPLFARISARLG